MKHKWLDTLPNPVSTLVREWLGAQPIRQDYLLRIWQRFRVEWSFHSNHIEGNTLNYGETLLLLIYGRTKGDHLIREYEEMKGHDVAIEYIRGLAKDERGITESEIRDLNKILLKEGFYRVAETPEGEPTKRWIEPGKYKSHPNYVITASGEIFYFTAPESVPAEMKTLVDWMESEWNTPSMPLLDFLARLHHKFSIIHPFDDGNGRVVRILINYYLLRLGLLPLVVSTYDRKEYLDTLANADTGDLTKLIAFLERCMVASLKLGLSGVDKMLDLGET
jgi:Fic family protein